MLMVGFDLGKRKSWAVIQENGRFIFNKKVLTTREDLSRVFGALGKCQILMEASTPSEWVARHLEAMGHHVIVADPNFQPMYAHIDKRIKSDQRDARGLLDSLQMGAYRAAVRRTDEELFLKATFATREQLVRCRTKLINRTKATLLRFGVVGLGETHAPEAFADEVRRDCPSDRLRETLEPCLCVMDELTKRIRCLDADLAAHAEKDEIARRLMVIPCIGPITALAFVHTLSDVRRFKRGDEVASYLGLAPSIFASGERESRGGITKRGDVVARTLLVGAALNIMRSKDPRVRFLREWANDLARRRGGKKKGGISIAKCALARRLATIMYAIWRDGTDFKAERTAAASVTTGEAAAE
jgi:transposase